MALPSQTDGWGCKQRVRQQHTQKIVRERETETDRVAFCLSVSERFVCLGVSLSRVFVDHFVPFLGPITHAELTQVRGLVNLHSRSLWRYRSVTGADPLNLPYLPYPLKVDSTITGLVLAQPTFMRRALGLVPTKVAFRSRFVECSPRQMVQTRPMPTYSQHHVIFCS